MAVLPPPVRTSLTSPGRKTRSTELPGVRHLLPRGKSLSVPELSARLYSSYEVLGGNVRLAGCALELRPIVLVVGNCQPMAGGATKPVELFLGDDGLPLDAEIQAELRLTDFTLGDRPTRFPLASLSRLIDRARWLAAENCRENGDELDPDSVEIQVVWRRFAEGKLRFTIGEKHLDTSFADWADRLQPPPFVCPETGVKTNRVAATDDGRIAAAEEIVTCDETGRRLLRSETVVCNVTRRRIASELADECPITGEFTERDRMATCSVCQMKVSPKVMDGDQCDACAAAVHVKKSDPRMCLILGEHPALDRWRRWRLAETPYAYVLDARSLMQRLLVVVDKQSLEVQRVAHRGRFQAAWHDVPSDGWRQWLQ